MKPEEKQFFVDLLAPLRELPESLSTSLAPLRDLPSVLRVLAGGSSQDLATDQARADDQHAAARVAELAGLEPVWGESLEDVVKRAIKHAVSQAIEQASIASPHELQSAREQGRIEAFAALVHAHSLEIPDGGRTQDVLNDAIVAGLESENAVSQAFDAGREAGRASGIKDALTSLASRAGAPELVATEDRLVDLLREGIEAGKSLREVRERAATGALLALLDDVAPGVRHERTGTGKVEDLVNGELRAEIARRFKHHLAVVTGEADVLAATLGRQAQDTLRALDGQIRGALHDLGQNHDGHLNVLIARLHDLAARPPAEDMEASAHEQTLDALAEARDTVARIDGILRPAVAATGVPVENATVFDLAERLVLIASRAVIAPETEIPRSARDGSRKTIRDIVAALGLDLQTDHLTVPRATLALVQALQGAQGAERGQERPAGIDPDTAALRVLDELRAALALQVNVAKLSPSEARDALARAARELIVGVRHQELDRGRQLVIDAVSRP